MQNPHSKTTFERLSSAISHGDVATLKAMLAAGCDINMMQSEETAFWDALGYISFLGEDGVTMPYQDSVLEAVRLACQHGAWLYPATADDAYFFLNAGPGAAMSPALHTLDTCMIAVLLDCGFDPNWTNKMVRSQKSTWRQSDLDLGICEYEEVLYGINCHLPEPFANEAARTSLDYIAYQDRLAVRQGIRRPDHLFLLHHFGARTHIEWDSLALHGGRSERPPLEAAKIQALAHCIVRDDWVGLQHLLRSGWHLNLAAQLAGQGPYPHTPVTLALELLLQQDERQGLAVDRSGLLDKLFAMGVEANNPALMSPGMGLFGPALKYRDAALIKRLLELGCDPNRPRGLAGETVFEVAYQFTQAADVHGRLPALGSSELSTMRALLSALNESNFGMGEAHLPRQIEHLPRQIEYLVRFGAKLSQELILDQ